MTTPLLSINLLTYNRLALLRQAVGSILAQSFGDFELLIYNNGSDDGTREYLDALEDPRIRVFHHPTNDRLPLMDQQIEMCAGEYISPSFADDDAFVPGAFAAFADAMEAQPPPDSLHSRVARYGNRTGKLFMPCDCSGKRVMLDADHCRELFRSDFSGWGVGKRHGCQFYLSEASGHSSCIFFSRELIAKTREIQGRLTVPPLGDIGYVGTLLHTKRLCRIDSPLVVIGVHQGQDMSNSVANRHHFDVWREQLQFSPLKGVSFVNMGVESHLKLLHANGMQIPRLRPCFFVRHLDSILHDRPWNSQTLADTLEAIPPLLGSLCRFALPGIWARIRRRRVRRSAPPGMIEEGPFASITEAATWLGQRLPHP